MKIRDEILERFNKIRERIVQAIHDGDWSAVAWNVAIVLAIVAAALGRGRSGLAWKVLGTLLGKIFAVPLVLFILVLSYKMNLEHSRAAYCVKSEFAMLDEWANGVCEYVRDAMFLVFRAVSEYTNLITPPRASAPELVDPPIPLRTDTLFSTSLSRFAARLTLTALRTIWRVPCSNCTAPADC